ncbi:hypothetical protein J6590_040973 [Homalodisca vitripennis]|nr:hypothetical protein J6590_040973 [Homalodisca vitripennis]
MSSIDVFSKYLMLKVYKSFANIIELLTFNVDSGLYLLIFGPATTYNPKRAHPTPIVILRSTRDLSLNPKTPKLQVSDVTNLDILCVAKV